PVLWRKIAPKLAAGRVQSVATRLLVERERERMAFVAASWWDANVTLEHEGGLRPLGPGSWWDANVTLEHEGQSSPASVVALDGRTLAQGRDFGQDGKLQTRRHGGVP